MASDAATSPGTPRAAGGRQEPGDRQGRPRPGAFRGEPGPANTSVSDFRPPELGEDVLLPCSTARLVA